MKKNLQASSIIVSLFLLIFSVPNTLEANESTLAGTQGITVLDILEKNNTQQDIRITGNLLEKTGDQQYIFTDGTEEIVVYIPDEYFPYPYRITSHNEVEIAGIIVWDTFEQPEIQTYFFEVLK